MQNQSIDRKTQTAKSGLVFPSNSNWKSVSKIFAKKMCRGFQRTQK